MPRKIHVVLLMALVALLAGFAVGAQASSTEITDITMTLRFIDIEESDEPIATAEEVFWGYEGQSYECPWYRISPYCPEDYSYRLRSQDTWLNSIAFPLHDGGVVDVQVMRQRLYTITYRMFDVDTNRLLDTKRIGKMGYYGAQFASNMSYWSLLPKGYSICWQKETLRYGIDETVTLMLRKRQTYSVEIRYIDANDEARVIGKSNVLLSGVNGETVYVQPEDGLIPYGWQLLDSSEWPVVLGGDMVAKFPVFECESFPVEIRFMNAATGDTVEIRTQSFQGVKNQKIYPLREISVPYGWTYGERYSWRDVAFTLGVNDMCFVNIEKLERFAIRVKLVDDETGDEIATVIAHECGVRGKKGWLNTSSYLPDGWRVHSYNDSIVLGETTECTVQLVREDYITDNQQHFPIRVHWVDRDTNEEIAVQTLYKRGSKGSSAWVDGRELTRPKGYQDWYSIEDSIVLGLTTDVTAWIRSLASYPPWTVTFKGVSVTKPSKVIDTQVVEIPYDGDYTDRSGLANYIKPPKGYRYVGYPTMPFLYGVTKECVYYLAPLAQTELTVRFVDQSNPETIVETRAFPIASQPGLGMCVALQAPDGWRLVGYDVLDGEDMYATAPIDVPVARLTRYDLTVAFVDAYTGENVAAQAITVLGEPNTRETIRQSTLTCPDGYVFADQKDRNVFCGQTDTVRFPVKRDASAMTTLALPSDLTTIEASAFADTAVERVVLPDGLTTIGAHAFVDCTSLCYVIVPSSVTPIDDTAFVNCPSLVLICEQSTSAWSFAEAHGIPHGFE